MGLSDADETEADKDVTTAFCFGVGGTTSWFHAMLIHEMLREIQSQVIAIGLRAPPLHPSFYFPSRLGLPRRPSSFVSL